MLSIPTPPEEEMEDLKRRAGQIQITAELIEVAASTATLDEFLKRAVDLIVMHLHFEHAAIFLMNEAGDYAELQAASGAFGQLQGLNNYRLHVDSPFLVCWVAQNNQPRVIADINQESLLIKSDLYPSACSEAGIPVSLHNRLLGVLHIQHDRAEAFEPEALAALQTIANLIAALTQHQHLLETTQQKLSVMEKRLNMLETLDQVSRAISVETSLDNLFKLIHGQVIHVMGEVDFSIALYGTENNIIEFPFAIDDGSPLHRPSCPLGQDLISIVIQSQQPLLLTKDVERQAEELGARIAGKPAKSWLGAPLLVGSEAIGAIVVQDPEDEQRFDENDQHFLTSLATRVAITIRNAIQLENARKQANRERIASEISTKLWASTDINTILRTAIQELSQQLEASEGEIQLRLTDSLEIGAGHSNNGNKVETS